MGAPYALSSDLVSAWPAKSLEVAQYIDGFKADLALVQNAQTGTTYTFVAADFTKLVTASNAAASTYTVPPQLSVTWPANTLLRVTNLGAGVVTFAGGVGVTVTNTAATLAQYQTATLVRTGSDAWTVIRQGAATPGMDLITPTSVVNGTLSGGEVSFSAAATLSVNGCFNSTYDAYAVWCQMSKTTDTNMDLRMRLSGTDATAANYDTQSTLNAGASIFNTRTLSATSGIFGYASTDHFSTINFQSPALAAITYYFSSFVYGPNINNGIVAGRHNVTTAYDGFSFIPVSGTMTGKLRVYGLRKS